MSHTADEIVKAVARAMWYSMHASPGTFERDWKDPNTRLHWQRYARAAYAECLRMLREPTFEAASAGGAAVWGHANKDKHELICAAHRAMIDDRIKELDTAGAAAEAAPDPGSTPQGRRKAQDGR